jgi:DNA-binding transcriptional MerR regulator
MALTVGQLAKLTGLTVRALHHYDAIGLLVPSQRSEAGYRLYDQADVVRLYRIVALQRLGLSLTDVAAALASDRNSLNDILTQQLAELDEQIGDATRTRDQLRLIQKGLASGDEPDVNAWLSALELMAVHGKHYSPQEWKTITTHAGEIRGEWPQLVAQLRMVIDSGAPPHSEQARLLSRRWIDLMRRKAGGDLRLMLKMKDAYEGDEAVRSHTSAQLGLDPAMMAYVTAALRHSYRAFWANHIAEEDLPRLDLSDALYRDVIRVIGRAQEAMKESLPPEASLIELRREWQILIDRFTGGDTRLRGKVMQALSTDASLQASWLLDAQLLQQLERGREAG